MSDEGVVKILWWLGLVAAPAVLIAIELFHPAHFTADPGMVAFLSQPQPYDPRHAALAYPGPRWWFALHMVQTPMVALVAVGLWLLVRPVGDGDGKLAVALAWLSRTATMVFLVYYTALDSIGGTGLGRSLLDTAALRASGRLPSEGAAGADLLLDTLWGDPWVGGVGSFVSEAGSFAVLAAAIFGAAGLWRAHKAPLPALALLVAFGWQLQTSHASPHGPIAFGLLIAAALWIKLQQRRGAEITDADARRPSRRSASR